MELRRPQDAPLVAAALLRACPASRVFTLDGPMGVGKTTLIKALGAALGVAGGMASPSFAIVHQYARANGDPVFHFDLYRLERPEELEGIGFTEYLDSGHYCFVEWPALGQGLYPPGTTHIRMDQAADGARRLVLQQHAPATDQLA